MTARLAFVVIRLHRVGVEAYGQGSRCCRCSYMTIFIWKRNDEVD